MATLPVTRRSQSSEAVVVRTRCPACRQRATFDRLGTDMRVAVYNGQSVVAGQRVCPDPQCHEHLFFIDAGGDLLATYPPATIDFDSTALPPGVKGALEEAVICHANGAFIAAAIMVRKTLEELCRERGASGSNLKKRIKALRSSVILPKELLDGLDELRLLGNDAAHVESRTFENVGPEEVEIALELTKEVLKGVYQLSHLVEKLASLKKREER